MTTTEPTQSQTSTTTAAPVAPAPKKHGPLGRLYRGQTRIDFIGRTKIWFGISAVCLFIGLVSLFTRGLNLGIDFEGGAVFEVATPTLSVSQARDALGPLGLNDPTVQELTGASGRRIRVSTETLAPDKATQVEQALAKAANVSPNDVNRDEVGPSWGKEISDKAVRALIIFLIVITLYITVRFEWKMALPTLVALLHDILITVGVYSVSGFQVTPATVIALLTILGYSIYDGIVVFDKVHENTRLVSANNRVTYSDMVNVSLNQTLMRSVNTTLTAVIPVASLLIVGSFFLGATTLQEFSLALFIGLLSGAYSSFFIASPTLAILKEREPRYRDIRRRMDTRGGGRAARATAADEAADADGGDGAGTEGETTTTTERRSPVGVGAPRVVTNIPPRPRKKGKRR
jgi:preprotein translocase subunit SecF